jgi:hypothetical protein
MIERNKNLLLFACADDVPVLSIFHSSFLS